jgi:hypothetical protein
MKTGIQRQIHPLRQSAPALSERQYLWTEMSFSQENKSTPEKNDLLWVIEINRVFSQTSDLPQRNRPPPRK